MDHETKFHFGPGYDDVDHRTLSAADVRARQPRDGKHLWSVGLFFRLDNPEAALDDMVLGAENLVATTSIMCAWCQARYILGLHTYRCPANQPVS